MVNRRKFMALSAMGGLTLAPVVQGLSVGIADDSENGRTCGEWGDQGDGTYANPVMPGDFSDIDAIRVGEDFYAMSSTFQYSPGVVILHSKDLVNWRILGHVMEDVARLGPEFNWDRMDRRGKGVWAGSLRFHEGKFWVYFNTPDEGFFMSTATNAAGPWQPVKSLWRTEGWDDPCPFWDDDGQGYLVATQFTEDKTNGKTYNIHLFKLSADGRTLLRDTGRILYQSKGSEANKLYKIDGLYYHLFSEVHPEGRVVMIGRSKSLTGEWEYKQVIHVNPRLDKEPNQGGLIQIPFGAWYFLTHQGTGDWEGRAGVLLPVTWIDGWPILGRPGPDGIGNMVWRGRKPIPGFAPTSLVADDEFNDATLRPEWEWNYQPRAAKWSLRERPGYLRLHAFLPLRPDNFMTVGNVLTQRCMRTTRNEVTTRLDISGLVHGQQAGLAHYGKTFCTLGAVQTGDVRRLMRNENGEQTSGPMLEADHLWLRSTWGFDGKSRFSYSLDGRTFLPIGSPYQLTWGSYRGDRIALFSFNTVANEGHADFDSFHYTLAGQGRDAPVVPCPDLRV